MKRHIITERADKAAKLESVGLSFHDWDAYWNEGVCYEFTAAQIDKLEEVTNELHDMCMRACHEIINKQRFAELGIPPAFWQAITDSFNREDFSLYGRFDLAYDGKGEPKMLEYNADTPTSLLESAVAQWYWLQDKYPDADQFNSLHERLVARWKQMKPGITTIHFASVSDNEEDWVCVHYLMDTAVQAGYEVKHVFVDGIGFEHATNTFIDSDNQPIQALFKLYPWEWIMIEEFGTYVATSKTVFVEPIWKAMLSTKGILPILWEMFPNHPNLLPTFFSADALIKATGRDSYAKKPLYSREGANIQLVEYGVEVASDDGPYGAEGHIYQALAEMPQIDGRFPVIGSWIVNNESAGMCIREDAQKITTNQSNFIPHFFK